MIELAGALLIAGGAAWIYLPLGPIVLGALLILAMQAFGARNTEVD
jgi:hypothetical protein